jgi:hypothetical protein
MGVGETVYQQLLAQREAQRQYRFDFMPPVGETGPYTASAEMDGISIHVVAVDFGRHGIMFESLRLIGSDDHYARNTETGLMRLVQRIVVDADSPYGPIQCIENDERLTSALLRTEPTAEGCYFEIIVEGGNVAEVKHFTIVGPGRERRQTPVNLGRRDFERMTDALAGAFCADAAVN